MTHQACFGCTYRSVSRISRPIRARSRWSPSGRGGARALVVIRLWRGGSWDRLRASACFLCVPRVPPTAPPEAMTSAATSRAATSAYFRSRGVVAVFAPCDYGGPVLYPTVPAAISAIARTPELLCRPPARASPRPADCRRCSRCVSRDRPVARSPAVRSIILIADPRQSLRGRRPPIIRSVGRRFRRRGSGVKCAMRYTLLVMRAPLQELHRAAEIACDSSVRRSLSILRCRAKAWFNLLLHDCSGQERRLLRRTRSSAARGHFGCSPVGVQPRAPSRSSGQRPSRRTRGNFVPFSLALVVELRDPPTRGLQQGTSAWSSRRCGLLLVAQGIILARESRSFARSGDRSGRAWSAVEPSPRRPIVQGHLDEARSIYR